MRRFFLRVRSENASGEKQVLFLYAETLLSTALYRQGMVVNEMNCCACLGVSKLFVQKKNIVFNWLIWRIYILPCLFFSIWNLSYTEGKNIFSLYLFLVVQNEFFTP